MPNWCANAVEVSSNNAQEQAIIDSLFNGTVVNRTEEMITKLRKIYLAGLAGILSSRTATADQVLDSAFSLSPNIATTARMNNDAGDAYSDFLGFMVEGVISPSTYADIDKIYARTGLGSLWWGDIPAAKRKAIKAIWPHYAYDYTGRYYSDVSAWWMTASVERNQSEEGKLDMRLLTEIPVKSAILVDLVNGRSSRHDLYQWVSTALSVSGGLVKTRLEDNGNYTFDTPNRPARSLSHLIPAYIANALNADECDLDVGCTVFFYEPGNAFQGIDDTTMDLTFTEDEESGEIEEDLLPEIAEAFGY